MVVWSHCYVGTNWCCGKKNYKRDFCVALLLKIQGEAKYVPL